MSQTCACPQCKAPSQPAFTRHGRPFCSQACADRHPGKQPCPRSDCHCEHAVLQEDEHLPPSGSQGSRDLGAAS